MRGTPFFQCLYVWLSVSVWVSLFLWLSCPSVSVSFSLFLSLCLSLFLFVHLCPSLCLFVSLSFSMSLSLFIALYLSLALCLSLSVYVSLFLSLSIDLSPHYLPPSMYISPCPYPSLSLLLSMSLLLLSFSGLDVLKKGVAIRNKTFKQESLVYNIFLSQASKRNAGSNAPIVSHVTTSQCSNDCLGQVLKQESHSVKRRPINVCRQIVRCAHFPCSSTVSI